MSCKTIYIAMAASKGLIFLYLKQDSFQYDHEAAIDFQKRKNRKNPLRSILYQN